jgi:RimJ/RimL family protein N-acetyltransferase
MLKESNSKDYMILNENKIVIGHMSLEIKNQKGEFNIVIGNKKYLGKGYGTLATKKIISLGFEKFALDKIYLEVRPENTRAIRTYEKSGFIKKRIKICKNINRPKVVVMEISKA